jgi:hypothetical protein
MQAATRLMQRMNGQTTEKSLVAEALKTAAIVTFLLTGEIGI